MALIEHRIPCLITMFIVMMVNVECLMFALMVSNDVVLE